MIIGIEGCDGTGKSTIAAAIAEEVQRRVSNGTTSNGQITLVHHGPPERSPLEEYATDIEGQEDQHWIFDRHHLGELVYPSLYRDQGPFGALGVAGFRWVEKFLEARGARIFVVDAGYDVVKERLEARGEDYLQSHHVEGVLERFRQVRALSVLTGPCTVVSPPLDEVPGRAKELVDYALDAARRVEPLRAFPSYVGGPRPLVLLVGEKRGGQPPFESGACFMPLRNKSGEFLWDALSDPFWRGVGIANAYEDDVRALWEVLGRPRVVALGMKACKALLEAGILHAAVPHPQYVKRFANKRQQEYGALIVRAAESGSEHLPWPS